MMELQGLHGCPCSIGGGLMNAVVILSRVSKESALALRVEDLIACDGRETCGCERVQENNINCYSGSQVFVCGVKPVCFGFSQNMS
jgi:hypothetical protein